MIQEKHPEESFGMLIARKWHDLTLGAFHDTLKKIKQEGHMTLLEYYLTYLSEICEGSREAPAGIKMTKTGDMERAIELQQQIASIGIPEFVRRCAAQDGTQIPQELFESFDPAQMFSALSNLETPPAKAQTEPASEETAPEPPVR